MASETQAIETLQVHWHRSFQQPLIDPPPEQPPAAPPPPPLELALLGTIIESEKAIALVSLPGGDVQFCSIGDLVGNLPSQAKVQAIEGDSVLLSYFDQEVTLQIPVTN